MSKLEFLSPEGYRLDGRKANELREFSCRIGDLSANADGSAQVEMGCTKVVAYVFGPSESSRYPSNSDKAEIHCNFTFAPFSRPTRIAPRYADRASLAKALSLRQVFESVILLEKHPKSHIFISIAVLEGDGGVFSAAINAATLALIDAGIPITDFVASCVVGVIGTGEALVDLNQVESNAVGAELTIAVHRRTQEITCFELDSKIAIDLFDKMEGAGKEACQEIATIMQGAVMDRFTHLAINS